MVNDFAGYNALFANGVAELACLAHARRTFVDLEKANGTVIAAEALRLIALFYRNVQKTPSTPTPVLRVGSSTRPLLRALHD